MAMTGATHQQVEAAAFKAYRNPGLTSENYGEYADWAMEESNRFAAALVPPDHRIVSVADLEAILRLRDALDTRDGDVENAWDAAFQPFDRIRALIGGNA